MNAFALFLATFSGIAIGSVLLAEYDARGRPEKNTVPEGNIKKWDLYTKVTASLLLATGSEACLKQACIAGRRRLRSKASPTGLVGSLG